MTRSPIKPLDHRGRKPDWLKIRLETNESYRRIKRWKQELGLNTVCEEAQCPNIHECWDKGTATFMILGNVCTRACSFCAVATGRPTELDLAEPERLAEAVDRLGFRFVVITSVARDDLYDGGASVFAECIRTIRKRTPGVGIEVLTPDFQARDQALRVVVDAGPDIFSHNVETVRRLSPKVRARARHDRSLLVLRRAKALARELGRDMYTKSAIMVGLGERREEIVEVMHELIDAECDMLTIGQYLQPSREHLPVERYVPPEEFQELKALGEEIGFKHVEAGPLVRSSYLAHHQLDEARRRDAAHRSASSAVDLGVQSP